MLKSIRLRATLFVALFYLALMITARLSQILYSRSIVTSAFEDQIQSRFEILYHIFQEKARESANKSSDLAGLFKSRPSEWQLPMDVLHSKIIYYPTSFFWGILGERDNLLFGQSIPGEILPIAGQSSPEKTWWTGQIGETDCLVIHRKLPSGETLFVGSPFTDIKYTLNYFIFLNVFFGTIFIIVITFGVWLIFGQIFKPLKKISNIATKIGSGLISSRIGIQDIDTELKPVGTSLNAMLDRLEQTIQSHARFNSEVSHELLAPLNLVKTNLVEMIESANGGVKQGGKLLECLHAVQKTTTLASDLLELARSESVSDHTHKWIDLEPVIDQVVMDVEHEARKKDIIVALESSTVGVHANPIQIHQVAHNLINNAIKYAPENSTVRVTLKKLDQQAVLSVYDSGGGVSPSEVDNLFKRFFRAQSNQYDAKTGYGLGLAICKNIIDQHKGEIGYERTAEGLTRFYVIMPTCFPCDEK